jgi:hypothetical protein
MQLAGHARSAGCLLALSQVFFLPVHIHDHPRGAKAALGAVEFGEICLNWVISISLVSNSFHGCNIPPVTGENRHETLEKLL